MAEAMYPACIAAGMVEQECCPNTERLMLSCCAGFPKKKKKKDGSGAVGV